jgi:hypothetical protein
MIAITIERVRAFNGLDVLVARDEGLFAAEGLDLRIAPAAVDGRAVRRINADKRWSPTSSPISRVTPTS